ncbi:MAG: hypothetical protein HY438_00890 [DPANN group archaeon]|nr:hypothetical protein [DPANN group archaeon]
MKAIKLGPEEVRRLVPDDRVFYLSKLSEFVSRAGQPDGPLSTPVNLARCSSGGFMIKDGHHRTLTSVLTGLPLLAIVASQRGVPLAPQYGLKKVEDLLYTDIAQEQARFIEQNLPGLLAQDTRRTAIEDGLRVYQKYIEQNSKPIIPLSASLGMHKAVLNTLTEL